MRRTLAPALILLVMVGSGACGRSRKPNDGAELRSGAGGAGGTAGDRSSSSGSSRAGAGGVAGAGTAGGRRPVGGTAGAAGAGTAGAGVPAGNSAAGFGGGAGTDVGMGTAGAAGAGFGGFGGGGFSGGGFSGGGFSGGFGGMAGGFAGTGEPQTCMWLGYCGYPDGSQCNGFTCCELFEDRCCDGTGRCSDPLPPPPEWEPPIAAADLGAPGWKSSTETFCPGVSETGWGSVWSDSRGVFVTSTVYPQNPMNADGGDGTCIGCPYMTIQHNDGTGWRTLDAELGYGQQRLKGIEGGALVLYGSGETMGIPGGRCGLAVLDGSTLRCEPVEGVTDVAITGTTAYAALQGDLVRYDGSNWGPVPVPFPGQRELSALWANPDLVVGTGMSPGKLFTLRNNTWTIENTRTLETFSTVFGLSSTDIWAGTMQEHVFRYDGAEWKQVPWAGKTCNQGQSGITAMWGKDGVLYFSTVTALARWNGTSVEVIASWDCNTRSAAIIGLWGNSANELFVLITDYSDFRRPCGNHFVMHYDGSKFHRM